MKTPIGTAWIDEDGILWHRLDPDVRVSASAAVDTVELLNELLQGRPAPAIVDIAGVRHADREAMKIFANLGELPELATAILVRPDDNPASAVHSFLFLKQAPDRPTEIFEDVDEAVAWAKTFLRAT